MKTSKTIIKEAGFEELGIRDYLKSVIEKYNSNPNDILIGFQGKDMLIQSFNTNKTPNWQTLEIIEF